MNIRCLIIDDEPLAVRLVSSYVQQVPGLEVAAACNSAIDAFKILREQKIDLVFLDIKMPKLLGTDFLRSIPDPPKVIFISRGILERSELAKIVVGKDANNKNEMHQS